MGIRYDVEVAFRTVGGLGGLDAIGRRAGELNRAFDQFTTKAQRGFNEMTRPMASVAAGLNGIAQRFVGIAATGGMIGIGLAATGAAYGVTQLNSDLESTQIALGTIYQAKGSVTSLADGMKLAKDNMALMRSEAARLPGEFEDLKNIVTTTASPLLGSGMSTQEQIKLSSKLMAAGAVLQMPQDQVAREAAQLFEGRSGAHNVLGVKLMGLAGDKAEKFNKMEQADQIQLVTTELNKYSGSLALFEDSFQGLSSTFIDNTKQVGAAISGPLFESVKHTLAEVNHWYTSNKPMVDAWARDFGENLAAAWEWASAKALEWGPIVLNFAKEVKYEIMSAYEQLKPTLDIIGQMAKDAFGSNAKETLGLMIQAGKTWATINAISAVAGVAGGIGSMVGGGKKVLGAAGWLGGAGTVAGAVAGAVGGGRARDPITGKFMAGVATQVAVPALAAVEVSAGSVALGLGALAVAVGLAEVAFQELKARGTNAELKNDFMRGLIQEGNPFVENLDNVATQVGLNDDYAKVQRGTDAVNMAATGFTNAGDAASLTAIRARELSDALNKLASDTFNASIEARRNEFNQDVSDRFASGLSDYQINSGMEALGKANAKAEAQRPRSPQAKPPVFKVEIVVTGNQDPTRIARVFKDELVKNSRGYTASPYTRNFSAARPG